MEKKLIYKDVTSLVDFGLNDDEILPLQKCICGKTWKSWKGPMISIYKDNPYGCEECGRKYYFTNEIRVYLVEEPKLSKFEAEQFELFKKHQEKLKI